MSVKGPAKEYLEALSDELRVGGRYRRRVLEELASHIDDAAERDQARGMSVEEAQRRAIERVGPVPAVAERFSTTRRLWRASACGRGVRVMAYLGAAVVLVCALAAPFTIRDSDGHLGLEVTAALIAAVALLLFDLWTPTSKRALTVLAGVVGVWLAAGVRLVSDGDVLFCVQVYGCVLAAAVLLSARRRLNM
ncbi:MAG: hypothetical protein E6G34_06615 [Actinobacteria bacterium]|nr:MAG: hypothetical protein E6G34_06615 [Actinomycetota bacterium]